MRRVWQAEQDQQIEIDGRVVPIVSQQALVKAFVDAAVVCDRSGGTISVVLVRTPTGFPGEMLTTAAVVEWKDRTDAKAQPEVADPFAGVVASPVPAQVVETLPAEIESDPEPSLEEAPPTGAVGDGLDDLDPNAVDESSVPAALQG